MTGGKCGVLKDSAKFLENSKNLQTFPEISYENLSEFGQNLHVEYNLILKLKP